MELLLSRQSAIRVFGGAAIVLLAICEIAVCAIWLRTGAQFAFNDFFGFWSFGRAATSGISVYDLSALRSFQNELTSAQHNWYPFFYPPSVLLLLIPLSVLPFATAYIVWSAGGLACYFAATLGRQWRSSAGIILLLAPTTLLTLLSGHSGLISSALLVGGLRQIEKRPALAGILFGLLTIKPQIGLLVPIVLLSARRWRIAGIAGLVAIALVFASGAVLGWGVWPEWVVTSDANWRLFWTVFFGPFGHLMPTVGADMRAIGASPELGNMAQAVVTIAISAVTWRLCAHGVTQRQIPAVMVGAALATPYIYIFDLPLMTAGLVIEWQRRRHEGIRITPVELAFVIMTYVSVLAMLSYDLPLVGLILLGLMFVGLSQRHVFR